MALTTEQQAQLDLQVAIINAQTQGQVTVQLKQAKLEAVRLAKETLIENARSKPVDSRDITAEEITQFANILVSYINA
jgi:hypothetical protein